MPEGTIDEKYRANVVAIHFKETPAHSAHDWNSDPELQFVITLSGTLETTAGNRGVLCIRRK